MAVNGNNLFSRDTKLMIDAMNSIIELLSETNALLIEIRDGVDENKEVLNEIKEELKEE